MFRRVFSFCGTFKRATDKKARATDRIVEVTDRNPRRRKEELQRWIMYSKRRKEKPKRWIKIEATDRIVEVRDKGTEAKDRNQSYR